MSGIARIQKNREDSRRPQQELTPSKEIWLKDGDQIFCTSAATGDENDTLLDDLYLYIFRVNNRCMNLIKDDSVDDTNVPDDSRPAHKFAFWAYVHNIIHVEKRADEWEEIEGPSGKKMYRENINDFRIITLGFGRNDYVWSQLVEIYQDWGALNKGVMRVKRTGTGAYDTSYSISPTPKHDEIPKEKNKEIKDLPEIKKYFLERYGTPPEKQDVDSSKEDDTSLF